MGDSIFIMLAGYTPVHAVQGHRGGLHSFIAAFLCLLATGPIVVIMVKASRVTYGSRRTGST